MATTFRYQIPVEQTKWKFEGQSDTAFTWEYEDGREKLLTLYDKGKKQQWDAAERLDWSQDLDPENPMMMDDRAVQIWGSPIWERLTETERTRVRHHLQAQSLSQFMHGEQGALIATAKIVQTVPDADAKIYPATDAKETAHRDRAGRARAVRRRGLLSHARSLQPARGVGAGRAARRGMHPGDHGIRPDAPVPHAALHPHRADRQGHRPVGVTRAEGLRRHG